MAIAMSTSRFDLLVFIGRFEPFHNGHLAVALRALQVAERVLVLIGSAGRPRTTRNPWSAAERTLMVREALGEAAQRVLSRPLIDHPYNETAWIAEVQRQVAQASTELGLPASARIGLIGQDKDASSYYLHAFPQWPLVDVRHTEVLSATDIRTHLLADDAGSLLLVEANVPPPVFAMLKAFRAHDPAYLQLKREQAYLQQYRQSWASAPWPPVFVTTDVLLVHSGHVLLVRRAGEPGAGLWALPGGFVDPQETLLAAALRELQEETALDIAPQLLRAAIRAQQVFDAPDRSARGRTITHAFHLVFDSGPLPAVRGGSDASSARWFAVAEALAMRSVLFDDHHAILEHFLGTT